MKNVALLAFRIGESTPDIVTPQFIDFYRWVSQVITKDDCKILSGKGNTTIPVDDLSLTQSPYDFYTKFHDSRKIWQKEANVLLIDLSMPEYGILRGPALIHLSQAIEVYFKEIDTPATVIILLSDLPPDLDPFRTNLNSHIKAKKIILIGNGKINKEYLSEIPKYRENEYQIRLIKIRKDPLELLKFKLIKRFGHFKKFDSPNPDSVCTRYYYDGELCKDELIELLNQYISKKYQKNEKPNIFYYAPISPWLKDTVVTWISEKDLNGIDISDLPNFDFCIDQSNSLPMLILPTVYSGNSLIKVIELIFGNKKPNVNVLAIMTTDCHDTKNRIRNLKLDEEVLKIDYLLKVDNFFYKEGNCPLCKIGIPKTNPDNDSYDMLTSFDMWDMVEKAGWKDEEDAPSYRSPLDIVPDLPNFIDQNGAWLSLKFDQILQSLLHGSPSSPIIVCPAEKGSETFSNYLRAIKRMDVIKIPKEIIEKFIEPDLNNIDDIISSDELWRNQLVNTTIKDLILLDEFNVSGTTRKGMINLVKKFNKNPLCYFSIIDFYEEQVKPIGIQCCNFYSFNYR
ncbi:hypothetical protein [uncultured Desulfosarcina sp.]|uniref:hypothetical protein n=1 Tax=uncultured Desulfosarcina sp. TaxID=218289 RepID=UPI0029C7325C|nr:hypothetical protein [uncultured Desulfosarcina sp.]